METATTMYKYYEVSQGAENKFYTLWLNVTGIIRPFRQYIKNLSTDYNEAIEKASEMARENNIDLSDETWSTSLRPIVRGEDVMRFGKYIDQRLSELPDGYLLWIAKGAFVPSKENPEYQIPLVSTEFKEMAKTVAVERGLYQEYNGKLMPITLIKYLQSMEAAKGFHFENGQKVKGVEVKLIKQTSFRTHYGYSEQVTYVSQFISSDGKLLVHKGNKPEIKIPVDGLPKGNFDYHIIQKGETVLISGTIEHKEYREDKITYIKRPKFLSK